MWLSGHRKAINMIPYILRVTLPAANQTEMGRALYTTLAEQQTEMTQCGKVDPTYLTNYFSTQVGISIVQTTRTKNFLMRKSLWSQFLTEDAQGLR